MDSSLQRLNVSVGGISVEYYDIPGAAGNLLILHGWAHSKERWLAAAHGLRLGLRIVLPDLPGFGNSEKPFVNYSLGFFSSMVMGFCKAIGWKIGDGYLLGHSMGGATAVKLAAVESPKKLILVDPVLFPVWPARLTRLMGPLAQPLFHWGRRSEFLVRQFAKLTVADAANVDRLMVTEAQKPTDWSMTNALRNLSFINLKDDVLSLKGDTLLIYGTKDRAVPPSQYDFLKSRANPRLRCAAIERCGHTPFIERGDEFLELCRSFLTDGGSAAAGGRPA